MVKLSSIKKFTFSLIFLGLFKSTKAEIPGYAKGTFCAKDCKKDGRFFKITKNNIVKEEFVLNLSNAKIYGEGYVLDNRNYLFKDTVNLWPGRTIFDTPLMKRNNFSEKKIDDSVVILSNSGENNYYHWLFQILPRIYIFQQSGFKCNKFYLANLPQLQYQLESLAILNIPIENIITGQDDTIISVNQAFVPSISTIAAKHGKFAFQGWVLTWLKEIFLDKEELPQNKLIYVSRADASFRRIVNENDLITLLKKFGFEIISLSKLSIREQAKIFNQARLIVAQHGAGLANLAFSRKDVILIEIESNPLYKGLVEALNGTHIKFDKVKKISNLQEKARILALEIPEEKIRDFLDIEIDMNEFEKTLESILKVQN